MHGAGGMGVAKSDQEERSILEGQLQIGESIPGCPRDRSLAFCQETEMHDEVFPV